MKRIITLALATLGFAGALSFAAPATAKPDLPPCIGVTSCVLPLP